MTKHEGFTPGPWRWYWHIENGEAVCGVFHEKHEGHAYSICLAPRYEKREQWEANAALIADAPALLDERDRLRKFVELVAKLETEEGIGVHALDWLIEQARAALKGNE